MIASPPGARHPWWAMALLGVVGLLLAAYLALPLAWRHYEHLNGVEGREMFTRTKQGIPGDPINVGLTGTQDEVFCVFRAAGWQAANPVTLASSLKIAGSVAFHRPYAAAPVSALIYDHRVEDLAFELAAGRSAQTRHHVRLWQVSPALWLGSSSFDKGVGVNHYTLRVTHHIDADLDTERGFLADALARTGLIRTRYEISGVGPTMAGHNGGGDPYFTDGEVEVETLGGGCKGLAGAAPKVLGNPWQVELKNQVWRFVRRFSGRFAPPA